jgi:hypothetical protein
MALPLGTAGVRSMPPALEPAVLEAMKRAMTERAIYFFPGMDTSRPMTEAEQEAWLARYEAGPGGIVAIDPRPGDRGSGGALFRLQLGTELLTNVLAAMVAAFLLMHLPVALGQPRRVLLTAALGLVVGLDVDASYWNWYGFPTRYFLAQVVDHTVGWLLAGLALARVCRPV